jgi:hypothetical protein
MKAACRVVLLAVGLLAIAGPAPAAADSFGPLCVSLAPAPNFFVLFFSPSGGNQFSVTGRDIGVGDRPLVGTGFVTGSSLRLGFSLYAVTPDLPSSVGSAVIDLPTGAGPGFARPVDGVDIPFTMRAAPCPPNATQ